MLTRNMSIENIISSDQVPTLPEVAIEVLRVARQPEPSLEELTRVVRMDPAIAGRIVKFANSPLFGIRRSAATIESAVVMLGSTMIRTLVLGFSLAQQGPSDFSLRRHFQQIWRETLFQGSAAEVLGERHRGVDPAVWFLAGLLQDAGRLVMLNVFQQEYVEQVIQGDTEASSSDREAQAFGFTHAQVSAALCRTWNLDSEIIEAVAAQHAAHSHNAEEPVTIHDAMRAATVCNEYMENVSNQPQSARHAVERELIHRHDCRPDEIIEVLAEMDCRARGLAAVLKADVGEMVSRESLLEQAQTALLEITLTEQLRKLAGPSAKMDSRPVVGDSRWMDHQMGVFNNDMLDRILPQEISASAEQEKTLGLLSVEFRPSSQPAAADRVTDIVEAVRTSVRPSDQIVRHGDTGLIVLLPELGMSMLAKVAGRITACTQELLTDDEGVVEVGGLMVVPTSRRVASIKSVLSGLEASLRQTTTSGREYFHILQGKKLRPVGATE